MKIVIVAAVLALSALTGCSNSPDSPSPAACRHAFDAITEDLLSKTPNQKIAPALLAAPATACRGLPADRVKAIESDSNAAHADQLAAWNTAHPAPAQP